MFNKLVFIKSEDHPICSPLLHFLSLENEWIK